MRSSNRAAPTQSRPIAGVRPGRVPVSGVDNCDFFLIVGANPLSARGTGWNRFRAGWRRALDHRRHGAKIFVVEPLRTETADHANVHLAVRPGQDWALLPAMVKVIPDGGLERRGSA